MDLFAYVNISKIFNIQEVTSQRQTYFDRTDSLIGDAVQSERRKF